MDDTASNDLPRQGGRVSDDEAEERYEFVAELHDMGCTLGKVKRLFRERFGDVSHRTIGEYFTRAKLAQLADAARAKADVRAESLSIYKRIGFQGFKDADRIKARERVDKLLGLEMVVPPLDSLCEQLGCTVDQLREAIAHVTSGPVPDTPLTASAATSDV